MQHEKNHEEEKKITLQLSLHYLIIYVKSLL